MAAYTAPGSGRISPAVLDRSIGEQDHWLMRKGTLARFEIYLGIVLFAAMLVLAGYGLVSALADRLDPKVRDCVVRSQQEAASSGKPMARDYAAKLCKHLEEIGAL